MPEPHDPARVRFWANEMWSLNGQSELAVYLRAYADALPRLERLARLEHAWRECPEWMKDEVLDPLAHELDDALAAQETDRGD